MFLTGELPVSYYVSRILPPFHPFQNGCPFRHVPILLLISSVPNSRMGPPSPLSSRAASGSRAGSASYGWRRVGRRRNPGTSALFRFDRSEPTELRLRRLRRHHPKQRRDTAPTKTAIRHLLQAGPRGHEATSSGSFTFPARRSAGPSKSASKYSREPSSCPSGYPRSSPCRDDRQLPCGTKWRSYACGP